MTKPITQRAKPISVTLGEDLIDALDKRCKADATTRSDIAREAIAAYLDRPDLVPVLPRGRQPVQKKPETFWNWACFPLGGR